jgi:DNA-binding transcriptional ArsR family regulator
VKGAGGAFQVAASGGGAARLAGLYFLYGPPLLEEDERIINHKLAGTVELRAKEALNVSWEGLRQTKGGHVAADLTISAAGVAVKYNVYLRGHDILLQFHSADRNRAELAARLLKLVGVSTEIGKVGSRDEWYVWATTDRLAAGREELRKALAEIVRKAVENGWVETEKAERWLRKLERGRMLKEGWPKYEIGLAKGALVVRFGSTSPASVEREAQRLRDKGLVEGVHFSVKMPESGKMGYVSILKEGLERAAWLSVHGEGERQRLATEFVEYILQRAKEESENVYRKALEVVEEGRARGSLRLEGFEKKVEVEGREHVVKVLGGRAEFDVGRSGKKLPRLRITAEVDGVRREYTITYGRYGTNAAVGFATARADAPDGREPAERLAAVIKALTGREPGVYRMKNGNIIIKCGREHLDGFMRLAELADVIEKWLEETRR